MTTGSAPVTPSPALQDHLRAATLSIGYLATGLFVSVAALVLALPLVILSSAGRHEALAEALTGWERRRTGVVLRRLIPHRPVPRRRLLAWLACCILVGLPLALLTAYLALGGINALTFPLWWTIVGASPASPLPGVKVDNWSTALLVPLIGLAYEALLLAAWPWLGTRVAGLSLRVLGLHPATHRGEDPVPGEGGIRGAELRRIERAMHDGVQAHLVNANMLLGLARHGSDTTLDGRDHLTLAGEEIGAALAELRSVTSTVFPPSLGAGLEPAVRALAAATPIPCTLDIGSLGTVPPEIEAAAYFGIAESLTNATRHSGASTIRVQIERDPDRLYCTVTDDGHGGARAADSGGHSHSTGLAGLRTRVNEFAGQLRIHSPAGGPTRISWELPCVP